MEVAVASATVASLLILLGFFLVRETLRRASENGDQVEIELNPWRYLKIRLLPKRSNSRSIPGRTEPPPRSLSAKSTHARGESVAGGD